MIRSSSMLADFDIDPDRGFLPAKDPLGRLPSAFARWEEIAHGMPKLLAAGKFRDALENLPLIAVAQLRNDAQLQRAMLLLSYFGHGYVWGGAQTKDRIPAGVAAPWHEIAKRLGRPPILSYASYALYNWRRVDSRGPIALGNIALLQNFLGGIDEEWFILVHVDIEARAGPALAAIISAQKAVVDGKVDDLEPSLLVMASALEQMYTTLLRMPEHCDPYIYYHRVRPYIHGWKDNPALPRGVIYEGVSAYAGRPQKFRGETGAQSSIIPALDAVLGISHRDDPLRPYLMEMREYMPPGHRAFIEAIEKGPSIRRFVLEHSQARASLREAYNSCVQWVERFRSKHLEYAALYIQNQSQRNATNPTDVGTGGTPFMPYLKKHRDETAEHLLD